MKILIADKFEQVGLDGLKRLGAEVYSEPGTADAALTQRIAALAPQVLIVRSTKVQAPQLAASPALKLVIRAGSGYDTIDINAAREKGIKVANCPGMNAVAVAELAFGHLLNLDRRISDNVAAARAHQWDKKGYSKARGVKGSTLGIVGMGKIGTELAKRALAFEMKVLWFDVIPDYNPVPHADCRRTDIDEIFRAADYVSLHVPGTGATKHLVNAARLATMKKHACIINTSRGSVVDEAALTAALKAGTIRAAALDVFENEPAADAKELQTPLADLPNVYISHHIGASTEQAQLAVAELTVKIVGQFLRDGTVLHCVND